MLQLIPTPLANRVPVRVRAAWHVLRGHPTAYRLRIVSGVIHLDGKHFVGDCLVTTDVAYAVEQVSQPM